MEPDPDLTLLRRFARGDHPALGELAARYERPLLGLALGIVSDRELARDAVQDMWVRVIKSATHFQAQSTVRTWMYRILINRALTLRQQAGAKRAGALPGVDPAAETPDAADEDVQRVRAAVHELPEHQRLVLLLSYHEGLGHEAAAEVLGIPVGTFKSRLHAALTALRGRLGAEVTA
jgi:RNA polymerase sigma-70 factor, ECF subfamily